MLRPPRSRPTSRPTGIDGLEAAGTARERGAGFRDGCAVHGLDLQVLGSRFGFEEGRRPLGEMAAAAVELVLHRIDQPQAPFTHRRFGDPWVVRRSTAHTPRESS